MRDTGADRAEHQADSGTAASLEHSPTRGLLRAAGLFPTRPSRSHAQAIGMIRELVRDRESGPQLSPDQSAGTVLARPDLMDAAGPRTTALAPRRLRTFGRRLPSALGQPRMASQVSQARG